MKLRNSSASAVIIQLLILVVNSQECMDKVGSLAHDDIRVIADYTFIFTDTEYTVACEGTVIAWEFCYRIQGNTTAVMTFYPGIWIPSETNATTEFKLLQSSTVTYTIPQVRNDNVLCETFNLSRADQFTAPAGSVVGLYSNISRLQSFLLRTNRTKPSLNSYRFSGNHSIVNVTNGNTRYNIALRVHLAQCPAPINGEFHCPKGHGDTCTFSCNAGYELQGSNNGTCLANQSWSGGDPICVALNCSTSPPLNNSQLQSSCDTQYQSTCTTVCVDGYTGVGGLYTCVVTDEDTNSVGWSGSTSCQEGTSMATDSSSSSVSTIPIVVGSAAGAALSFVTLLLIVLCVRIYKKKSRMSDTTNAKVDVIETGTELNLNISMTVNPSYNITKHNGKQEDQYDYVLNNKCAVEDNVQGILMMDCDPTSEGSNSAIPDVVIEQGYDVAMNPLYSSNSSLMETMRTLGDEDEDGYIKTNSLNTQTASYLKIIGPIVNKETMRN